MRITGRELRRVINEEVRRSMKLNLREDAAADEKYGFSTSVMIGAAATASESTRNLINDYLKACSSVKAEVNKFVNNELLSAQLGAAQGHFIDITKKGSASVYSAAINNALLKTAQDRKYEQAIAVIGTLQSGKWTDLGGAYATLAGAPNDALRPLSVDIRTDINGVFSGTPAKTMEDFLSAVKDVISTDIIGAVTRAKEESVAAGAAVAAGREKTKSDAAASSASTALDAAKWEKYDSKGESYVDVHDKWDEFAASSQNRAEGSKFTNSFADFVRYYKATAENTGKTRISPAELIVLIDAHIEKGFETSES